MNGDQPAEVVVLLNGKPQLMYAGTDLTGRRADTTEGMHGIDVREARILKALLETALENVDAVLYDRSRET